METYKINITDEFDNEVDSFVTKAKDHKAALKKSFNRWLEKDFEEETFGKYAIKINIEDEEFA